MSKIATHDHDAQAMRLSEKYCRSLPPLVFLTAAGALTVLFALNCTLAHAQGPPPGGMPGGKPATPDPLVAAASRWDANHDGVFTCEEWKQYASRLFILADKNTDGFLAAKEFQQLGKVEPIFADAEMAYFDDNHDQRLSRKEFADKPSPLFARYDANRDCRVTAEELKAANGFVPKGDGSKRGSPKGGGPGGMGGGGPGARGGF